MNKRQYNRKLIHKVLIKKKSSSFKCVRNIEVFLKCQKEQLTLLIIVTSGKYNSDEKRKRIIAFG